MARRRQQIRKHPEHVKITPLACICGATFETAEALHAHVWPERQPQMAKEEQAHA